MSEMLKTCTPQQRKKRGRPRVDPEKKISNAEAQRRYRSDPIKRERARLCSERSRIKRRERIAAIEKYIKDNDIVLPPADSSGY